MSSLNQTEIAMHHMAMLRLASINALSHALECHKDHLNDAREEMATSARGALNGRDFDKYNEVSGEIARMSGQLKLIEYVESEISKSKRIGKNAEGKYQFQLQTEWAPALYLVVEQYCEMQYDILKGDLRSVTRGEIAINHANVILNVLDGEDSQLERTVEAAFLEGYFQALTR